MILGITGQFASGKSTVARIIAKLCRAVIIDADKIGHLVLSDSKVKMDLKKHFGKDIIIKGAVNRKALAEKAFAGPESHKALCRITHPLLAGKILDEITKIKAKNPQAVIIIDAAVLIEMGLLKYVDKLAAVKINRVEQIRRGCRKWKLSPFEINKRIKLQIPASRLFKKADFIIDNSGNPGKTRKQIQKMRDEICQKMKK